MKMIFSTRRKKLPPPKRTYLKTLLTRAVDLIGLDISKDQALALSIVGPITISRLKQEFFGVRKLTDVICFDYRNSETGFGDDNIAIDIIICSDVAEQQGKIIKASSYSYEMVLYIIHGLLHAAGEDDNTPVKTRKMKRKEQQIMKVLEREFEFSKIFPEKTI